MTALSIQAERLVMSLPHADLAASMLDFASRNRDHLKAWNPPEPDGLYTLAHWQDVVQSCAVALESGRAVRFWMTTCENPQRVIGSIGYSQIARGPFCSCVLATRSIAGTRALASCTKRYARPIVICLMN